MSKFKVGDKVTVRADFSEHSFSARLAVLPCMLQYAGKSATVIEIDSCGDLILSVHPRGKNERTCFFDPNWVERSSDAPVREFIVIRRDKQDIIASHKRGDEIVKTAKATCAPSDEFNFETGAKLAFDRLMGRETLTEVDLEDELKPYRIRYDSHPRAWNRSNEVQPAPEPKYYSGKVRATGVRGTALERGRDEYTMIYYDRVGVVFEFKNGDCPELGMSSTKNFDEIVKVRNCSTWQEVKE